MGLVLKTMSASLGTAGTKYSDGSTNQIKVIGELALRLSAEVSGFIRAESKEHTKCSCIRVVFKLSGSIGPRTNWKNENTEKN